MRAFLICLIGWMGVVSVAGAASQPEVEWPDTRYDASVPTFDDVLGYSVGAEISSHAQVQRYFAALAQARPQQMQIREYGESWERRTLIYAVIGSPENLARLDAIQSDIGRIASGTLSQAEADRLAAELPGTVWLSYAVHGNEISSTDAALMTAYHLLAATDDPVVENILDNALVFIDPIQNPDGRDRFVNAFNMARGLEPAATRLAAEHAEPWPSGRVNHYLFDLNRDWLALTQPETRARVKAIRDWLPLAFVDAHEMGPDSTYFFAPEAVPFNPHLAPDQQENLVHFGRNNAKWFDRFGIDYFTREIFDAFYPGYGASWPSYYGGIAMTYEQASARGLLMRRSDGSEFTYESTVRNHFLTSISTAETVANRKNQLWKDFHEYRSSAIREGRNGDVKAYLLPAQIDQGAADKLAAIMVEHGATVHTANASFSACGNSYSAGTHVIPMNQPAKRMIRSFMDPDVPMDDEFLKEQERRRANDLGDEIYDVTAWSLPLMFNVDMDSCGRAVSVDEMQLADTNRIKPGEIVGNGNFGWVVSGGDSATVRLLAASLRAGLNPQFATRPFSQGGQSFPAGSLIFQARGDTAGVGEKLAELARSTGASIKAIDDSWVTDGPSFGSPRTRSLRAPSIAIAWGEGASTYAPGATRFVIERQIGYPVTAVRPAHMGFGGLDTFDVLILPDSGWGGYGSEIGTGGAADITEWVEAGGVLVVMADAIDWAASSSEENPLLAMKRESQYSAEERTTADEEGSAPGTRLASADELEAAVSPADESPDSVAGILARADVMDDHWMGAGVADQLNVLVRGSSIYSPVPRDVGTTIAHFAGPDDVLVSGYMWDENRLQLAYKPFVVVQDRGNGMVIAFTQDPTVRAYLDGLNTILANAVLVAPSFSSGLR